MVDLDQLAGRFARFVDTTRARAPLYARLSAPISTDPQLLALLHHAPETQQLPVLLFAAVHDLLLDSDQRDGDRLRRHYPNLTDRPDAGDPFPAFRDFCLDHADQLAGLLATRHTQTNEVGRCAQFVPALGLLAAEVGSLAMVDVGTSAGLNLALTHYRYDYAPGGVVDGSAGSPVTVVLPCATRGEPPIPAGMPPVIRAVGLDANPIDVGDVDAVRWLEACVWPDQADRFRRLVDAVEVARAAGVDVRAGDAVDRVAMVIEEVAAVAHPVVVTSWALNYLPGPRRLDFVAQLDRLGRTGDLSWIVAESPQQTPELPVPATPDEAITVLSVVRWRGGRRSARRLATTHPHGYWLSWST